MLYAVLVIVHGCRPWSVYWWFVDGENEIVAQPSWTLAMAVAMTMFTRSARMYNFQNQVDFSHWTKSLFNMFSKLRFAIAHYSPRIYTMTWKTNSVWL